MSKNDNIKCVSNILNLKHKMHNHYKVPIFYCALVAAAFTVILIIEIIPTNSESNFCKNDYTYKMTYLRQLYNTNETHIVWEMKPLAIYYKEKNVINYLTKPLKNYINHTSNHSEMVICVDVKFTHLIDEIEVELTDRIYSFTSF